MSTTTPRADSMIEEGFISPGAAATFARCIEQESNERAATIARLTADRDAALEQSEMAYGLFGIEEKNRIKAERQLATALQRVKAMEGFSDYLEKLAGGYERAAGAAEDDDSEAHDLLMMRATVLSAKAAFDALAAVRSVATPEGEAKPNDHQDPSS